MIDEIYEATKNETHKTVPELIAEIKLGVDNECYWNGINDFIEKLTPRLTDAIYKKDVQSVVNLMRDVKEEMEQKE